MRTSVVRKEIKDVDDRLAELGVPRQNLEDAAKAWSKEVEDTSEFEPVTAAGTKGYFASNGAFREAQALLKWASYDVQNWPVTVSPDSRIAITITSGDHRTGLVEKIDPTTKNPKGHVVTAAVEKNKRQLSLGTAITRDHELGTQRAIRGKRGQATWATYMYLVHVTKFEVRSELSLPSRIEDGQVTEWAERIILPPIPLQGSGPVNTLPPDSDSGAAVDVPVRRK